MNATPSQPIVNAMTVDVEEYFHVSGFRDVVRPADWATFESRVEMNTHRLLDIFAAHDVSATFFILGWVAERHPGLVRSIQSAGHEVACHGYAHKLAYECTPDEFRDDVSRSKKILEDITGKAVIGYRAPSFSIVKSSLWALEILAEEGFKYDSSIVPIRHDRYGIPGALRFPHRWKTNNGNGLMQFPVSTLRAGGLTIPVGGGGYLRLFPYAMTRWAIHRLNQTEKQPAIMYIHPWELDPAQPRIQGRSANRLRHYVNLHTTEAKLRRLLGTFAFTTLREMLEDGPETGLNFEFGIANCELS